MAKNRRSKKQTAASRQSNKAPKTKSKPSAKSKIAQVFGALKKVPYEEWHRAWLKGLQVHADSGLVDYNQDILLT